MPDDSDRSADCENIQQFQQKELESNASQLRELEADIRIILRLNPSILESARQAAHGAVVQGAFVNPADNARFQDECRRFFEKYRPEKE